MRMTPTRPLGCVSLSVTVTSRLARSMIEVSVTSHRTICAGSSNAISSPASGCGATPCAAPAGPMIAPSGPALAPANLSPVPASASARPTPATSGPSGGPSSASIALSRSLASKLLARLDTAGGMLYPLTWKAKHTPARRPILQRRASPRRTSGSVYSGWPTCTASLADKGVRSTEGAIREAMRSHGPDLAAVASLATWPTPCARDYRHANGKPWADRGGGKKGEQLNNAVVHLAGWGTPKTTMGDYQTDRTGAQVLNLSGQAKLAGPARLLASGQMLTGSAAQMDGGGQLSPAHSRWLMGLPVAWDYCGAMAMQSMRRSRKNLSGR